MYKCVGVCVSVSVRLQYVRYVYSMCCAHHHLVAAEGSLIVQAKLGNNDSMALPLVILPHTHVLLTSRGTHTDRWKSLVWFGLKGEILRESIHSPVV